MFPLIAFTTDTVSRLTGLTVRQLHGWDRTGFFVPSFADPQRRRPYSRVYSFDDIVGLRTIARLRDSGVSFPDLKRVREFFASSSNRDWASRRFYVVGRRVFFTHEDAVLAARPLGQRVDQDVLDLGPIVSDLREAVHQLTKRESDQIGEVVTDRLIMSGVPIIAGTRIPTATIEWFHHNGYGVDAIIREFPRLEPDDVQAALDWERGRRGDAPRAAAG